MAYGVTSLTMSRYTPKQVQEAINQQGVNGQGFAEGALYIREVSGTDEVWIWTSRSGHQRVTFEAKNFRFTYKPDSPIAIGDWADDSQQTITIGETLDYVPGERIEISYDQNNYWLAEVDSYDPDTGVIVFTVTEGIAEGTDSFSIFTFDLYNPSVRNENVLSVKIIVASYTALTNQTLFTPADGDFALVTKEQGTRYFPGIIGGTHYSAGLYIYNGGDAAWEFLSTSLSEGVYQAVQNQPSFQTLSAAGVTVTENNAIYDATNGVLYYNISGADIDGVDTDTVFDVVSWGSITAAGDSNVQSDWTETDTTDDAYIQNKPTNLAVTDADNAFTAAQTINTVGLSALTLNHTTNAGSGSIAELNAKRNTNLKSRILMGDVANGDGFINLNTRIGSDLNETAISITNAGVDVQKALKYSGVPSGSGDLLGLDSDDNVVKMTGLQIGTTATTALAGNTVVDNVSQTNFDDKLLTVTGLTDDEKTTLSTEFGFEPTITAKSLNPDKIAQDGATDGQALVWNDTNDKWQPGAGGGGGDGSNVPDSPARDDSDDKRYVLDVPSGTDAITWSEHLDRGFVDYTAFADLPGTDATPPAVHGDLARVLVENATYPAYMWFDGTVGDNGTWISTGMVVDEGNGLTLNATTRRLEMNEATDTQRGTVGIGAQTFGGVKTFASNINLASIAAPTGTVGDIYFDSTDNTFKAYQNATDGYVDIIGVGTPLQTKITGGTDVDTTGIDINSNELSYAITSGVATLGIADTVLGSRTFQFSDDDNDSIVFEKSDGTDLFRITGSNVEINNGADIIIHQGNLTEDSTLQKLVFVEGSGFDATETGYLNATRMRLFSRWGNGELADGFDLPEIHTSTVAVAFDTDDADAWQVDNPAFAMFGTANHNNADRTVYDIEVHTRGNGTNVDSRFVFKTMNDNSQVDTLFIEHDRIRPQLATIFENKLRFDEKTTTELAAIVSPLEGDVYYNTTIGEPQYYDGTNFVAFVASAVVPGWSQNDGNAINPTQINIDTTGPLTYVVSDGVITLGSTSSGGSDVPDAPARDDSNDVEYILSVPTDPLTPISWEPASATGGSAFTTDVTITKTDPRFATISNEAYVSGNEIGRWDMNGRNTADDGTVTYASIFADNTSLITIGDTTNTTMIPGLSQFKGNTEHIDDLTETGDNEYNASSIGFVSADGNGDAYTGASIFQYIVDRSEDETELHFFAGDGNAADELLLNLGQTRAHFGDLDSEIQDRSGDLDANIRVAYPLNTWSFQTNDFYRYKPVGELGAIQDTFLNDRAPSDRIPLYIGLTQGRWNLKDGTSDATNVSNLSEIRKEYNEDTNDRWGSYIISTYIGDRDSATVEQYDTLKVEPGEVTVFGDADGNTEGDKIFIAKAVGTYFYTFAEVTGSGAYRTSDTATNATAAYEGQTGGTTDTVARTYRRMEYNGEVLYRVEGEASDTWQAQIWRYTGSLTTIGDNQNTDINDNHQVMTPDKYYEI